MKTYCQGPKCHTYDTTDRKRGPKENRRNQTRTIGTYGYGDNNFCTLNCQNDWWAEYGTRVIDYIGRIKGMKNKREKTREEKIAERLLYEKQQSVN